MIEIYFVKKRIRCRVSLVNTPSVLERLGGSRLLSVAIVCPPVKSLTFIDL